jgi:hypothetical protein
MPSAGLEESLSSYGWCRVTQGVLPEEEVGIKFIKDSTGGLDSLELPNPFQKPAMKNPGTLMDVIEGFRSYFDTAQGVILHPAQPMIRRIGNSIFTSSVGQLFDPIFFGTKSELPDQGIAAVQPAIRLKSGAAKPAFTRSFVNLGLIHLDVPEQQHLNSMDTMLNWFSKLGIYIPDIHLLVEGTNEDWGNGPFNGHVLRLMYGDVELGVANYFSAVPTNNGRRVPYSDISVGAERIQWARTKKADFASLIAPPEQAHYTSLEAIDILRTLTLASIGRVLPSDKSDGGQKMALLMRAISIPGKPIDYALLRNYYFFWNRLTNEDNLTSPDKIYAALEEARSKYIAEKVGMLIAAATGNGKSG